MECHIQCKIQINVNVKSIKIMTKNKYVFIEQLRKQIVPFGKKCNLKFMLVEKNVHHEEHGVPPHQIANGLPLCPSMSVNVNNVKRD